MNYHNASALRMQNFSDLVQGKHSQI